MFLPWLALDIGLKDNTALNNALNLIADYPRVSDEDHENYRQY